MKFDQASLLMRANVKYMTIILLTASSLISFASDVDLKLANFTFSQATISIPRVERPPVIDGKIGEDWRNFTECNGFHGNNRLLFTERRGSVRICRDDKYVRCLGVL